MTELIERLYIGNWMEAKSHSDEFYVVTAAHDSPFVGQEHFRLVDGPGNQSDLLVMAAKSVCAAREQGRKVLVHDHGARSRSCAVAVVAMMMITGDDLCECYDFVRDKHDITGIHPYLCDILLDYDKKRKHHP